jgi:hypothetical protein
MAKHQPSVSELKDLKPGTEWYSVPGFPRYWITKDGLVSYQDDAGGFRLKALPVTQSGHRLVALTEGQVKRSVNLLRLMAEVFIGQAPEGHRWVVAKDGNIGNVAVSNVSWSDESPIKGKAKITKLSSAEKTSVALKLSASDVASVARETGLPVTYVRHLKPGHVYDERDRTSPLEVSHLQFSPPVDPVVEEWRQIPEAPGYDASSFGRVRSWRGLEVQEHIPVRAGDYLKATLQASSAVIQTAVHRLVAAAFCHRQRPEQLVVNHKDGNKLNNHYSNLEWVTHSENMQHAHDAGLWQAGPTHGKRWLRPHLQLYDAIRSGTRSDGHPDVVSAIRLGFGWADQGPRDGEDWLPIEDRWGLETQLEVSSLGRVRRASNQVLLLQGLSTHGYPVTRLYLGGGRSMAIKTHTLVAEAFICRRPSSKHVVNHKDSNKQNNSVSNLEWATYAQNSKHWSDNRLRP